MDVGLKITTEQVQDKNAITIFHLRGWLDATSEQQLVQAGSDVYAQGARFLLLDLSEVDTITSAGMRAIQKVYKLFTPQDDLSKVARLKMCNAPPKIYAVLGLTGFLQNIPNYESMQTALDSFNV